MYRNLTSLGDILQVDWAKLTSIGPTTLYTLPNQNLDLDLLDLPSIGGSLDYLIP